MKFPSEMENNLDLLGTAAAAAARGVPSGDSATGPVSNLSKEDHHNMAVFSSEVSSSYPDDDPELELGLGLSLGGASFKSKPAGPLGQYARILTGKDFPSSSSSSLTRPNNHNHNNNNNISSSAGTKRAAAGSVSPPNGTTRQVVGWPPVGVHRMNSLVNQAKLQISEEVGSIVEENKSKNEVVNRANNNCNKINKDEKEKEPVKASLFVKVKLDGVRIGRKVDLKAHSCYEKLAQTLQEMFFRPTTTISAGQSSMGEHSETQEAARPAELFNGLSEFVLTYEDKDGDWMLVGDVPWRMFLNSVKRLRIMRTSEANGLDPKFQERSGRPI